MLWERMNLSRHRTEVKTQISRLTDNGPGRAPRGSANKLVRYTVTRIPESTFIKCHVGYLLESSGNGKYRFVLAPDRRISPVARSKIGKRVRREIPRLQNSDGWFPIMPTERPARKRRKTRGRITGSQPCSESASLPCRTA